MNFPIFFVAFVIFLIILNMNLRKHTRQEDDLRKAFWQREQLANTTRRQDISNLDYFTLPAELIPGTLGSKTEQQLTEIASEGRKMLNLTDMTNTDIKLKYGAANLEELSVYEEAYVDMITKLLAYEKELEEAGETAAAKKLLDFAVACGEKTTTILARREALENS